MILESLRELVVFSQYIYCWILLDCEPIKKPIELLKVWTVKNSICVASSLDLI